MATTKSPFYRNAFLYQGVHVMPGCQLHKLLEDKKEKEAAAHHKETQQREAELLRRITAGETAPHVPVVVKKPEPEVHYKASDLNLVIPPIHQITP